jgi:uncharacterized protein YcbX
MRVAELWRYPVKSLQGERLESARIGAGGIEGDRRFAIHDVETGFGLTARREPELLFASARLVDGGEVEIVLPEGSVARDDAALTAWLGRPVRLERAGGGDADLRFENPVDFEDESGPWRRFGGGDGPFHDNSAVRVSLVSTTTIGGWDRRRFRSNVLLDGGGEDELAGCSVTLGEVGLEVGPQIKRCVMTTRAQPNGIERDLDVLRTIAHERDARLAVGALVRRPGVVRVGDELTMLSA